MASEVDRRTALDFQIREETRQIAYVRHIWVLSCAMVRNCNAILRAYEGATNFDTEYVDLIKTVLVKARAKASTGEEWLIKHEARLTAMVNRFDDGDRE